MGAENHQRRASKEPKIIGGYAGGGGPRRRGKRPSRKPQPLSIEQILAWADDFHARTGQWPDTTSGRVRQDPFLTWAAVNTGLHDGHRGLPGGSSLGLLLRERRGAPYRPPSREPLPVERILAWADEHYARTGKWPTCESGLVHCEPACSWAAVDVALRNGNRGLPGGSDLAQLLLEHRGVPPFVRPRPLTIEEILAWADAHYERTGQWPNPHSGSVPEAPGETWEKIKDALRYANRGLPAGFSLATLLAKHRGKRNRYELPPLAVEQVLKWADEHHHRTGRWPRYCSGPVFGAAEGETWGAINHALRDGRRGLPRGTSLGRVLGEQRGATRRLRRGRWTVRQILAWADQWRRRTRKWPMRTSGLIAGEPGLTWMAVDEALRQGTHGLRRGLSLHRILVRHRGLGRLTVRQILTWADEWRQRTGEWPNARSGPISTETNLTWVAVDLALRRGTHGLPGGLSLHRLLLRRRSRATRRVKRK